MAKTAATDPGYAACPIPQYRGPLPATQMVPAGAHHSLHTGGRLRFSEVRRRMTDISQKDARLDPAAARTRTACFRARSTPKCRRASEYAPHAPRRIAHAPSRPRSSAGHWEKGYDAIVATATPCKQPDRIYKSRTRKPPTAGLDHHGPQPARPYRPLSQMPGNRFPATVPERGSVPAPPNTPDKCAAAPCPLQIEKSRKGTFSIYLFRKHKPRAVLVVAGIKPLTIPSAIREPRLASTSNSSVCGSIANPSISPRRKSVIA